MVYVRETALNVALMYSLSSFVFCDASTLYLNSYRTRGEGVESSSLIGDSRLLFHVHIIQEWSRQSEASQEYLISHMVGGSWLLTELLSDIYFISHTGGLDKIFILPTVVGFCDPTLFN